MGEWSTLWRAVEAEGKVLDLLIQSKRNKCEIGCPTENVALAGGSALQPQVRWSSLSVATLSGSHDGAYSLRSISIGPHPDWAQLTLSQIASTRAFSVNASRQRSVVSLPSGPVMA
jgi:hypothetical protein